MKTIYLTCKDESEAKDIGKVLVEEKLAACVNYFPIDSIFRWEGKIEEEKEFGMLIKTKTELIDEVIARIKELHSYDIPCIEVLSVEDGNSEFLDWVEKETKNK
tara:strand:- start:3120 stop:3431 length:312 start_codon:yes stop_codon:yes gene_type:complete